VLRLARGSPDVAAPWYALALLALAVVHHLMVTGHLSPEAIRDLFWEMTEDSLVLEFVPAEDVMFQELLKRRVGGLQPPTLDRFLETFQSRFTLLRQERLAESPRTLLFLRKR
jgi:hypothetical protein